MTINKNPQFLSVIKLLEDAPDSLFITGRAGTGKSTLLQYFKSHTKQKVIVLAPTGVAAVNIGGATIHSFFGFKPDITVEKAWAKSKIAKKPELYQNLDAIVIDEISMVRADLLDCVDAFMRGVCHSTAPFGGKRVIFFGDLYQLPPVVTKEDSEIFATRYDSPYFFSADVISRTPLIYIELEHIYRQHDQEFIEVLNAIRHNELTADHLALLNTRLFEDYAPPPEEYVVYLTGTNHSAQSYNDYQLHTLPGKLHTFHAKSTGSFDRRTQPAPKKLELKIGAQVMMTCNDRQKRFINGTVGRVEDIGQIEGEPVVSVRLSNNNLVDIAPNSWEMFKFSYHKTSNKIQSEVQGTYTQLPLLLSWGITIHKSQGKTFERLAIDLPISFAHGQTYVALSRATSLSGIILKRPLTKRHIIMDPLVSTWLTMLKHTNPSSY